MEDIENDPRVLVTFPASNKGEFFEIEGRAELADDKEVDETWEWWLLHWVPDEDYHFRIRTDAPITNRAIINVYPESARIVKQP